MREGDSPYKYDWRGNPPFEYPLTLALQRSVPLETLQCEHLFAGVLNYLDQASKRVEIVINIYFYSLFQVNGTYKLQ